MCSIVAASGDYDIEIIKKIFFNSRIRGLHSFGFSYVVNGEIQTHKFTDYDKFVELFIQKKPSKFIAHFRYSTSGDWKLPMNNQPILIRNICLAFNGVIDMSTKTDMEKKFGIEMQTENDGEIAIHKYIDNKEHFLSFINEKKRTFAGVFLNSSNEIIAIKNNLRPLSVSKHSNTTYIASTSDILERSGLKNIDRIKPNHFYGI